MSVVVSFQDARKKAREVHFGHYEAGAKAPGRHIGDSLVEQLLVDSLTCTGSTTRAGRSAAVQARRFWAPSEDKALADLATKAFEGTSAEDFEESDPDMALAIKAGIVQVEDQYTAERVRNQKTEVLSRFVAGLIAPQTPIINNFFKTIQADAGESLGQLREFVTYVESLSDWHYYMIDPNRGDIRSIEVNIGQHAERVTTYMQMYGARVDYENYLYRVLPNVSIAEVFAMLSVGWAKASAVQREYDGSMFLMNFLSPTVAFDNNGGPSALGQLTGVGIKGYQNGTFNLEYDFPRLLDYMEGEMNMQTDNIIALLPRNAWPFLNTKKGYRQFLGLDGTPLYQRPSITGPQKPAGWDTDRYGIRAKGIHAPVGAAASAKYLQGSRQQLGATAGETMLPGVYPFLPEQMPNTMNVFQLPNAAFPGMRVVLSPYVQAAHKFYAEGHKLRNDDVTGKPRPVLVTDILLFDGNHPLYLIETIPPTSWTATNEEYRKSTVIMVEAYAMANSARGQQATLIKGAVADHNFTHDLYLNARDVEISDQPLAGGLTDR